MDQLLTHTIPVAVRPCDEAGVVVVFSGVL